MHDSAPSFLTWHNHSRSANARSSVRLELVTHTAVRLEKEFRLPPGLLRRNPVAAVRYLAACVNNTAMVHGVSSYRLHGEAELARTVAAELHTRYPQVRDLASALTGGSLRAPSPDRDAGDGRVPLPPTRPAIGINIGQSAIKGVATSATGAVLRRIALRTDSGTGTRGERLRGNTFTVVRRLLSASPTGAAGIGVATGGIVHQGRILPGSGITLGLTASETEVVRDLPQKVAERFGRPVLVDQDARSKAYFHRARLGLQRCLVVDLGTSLGGAYIDARRTIPALLNQVGRVAYDLSDDAQPRTDGRGRGLLSQRTSAAGIRTTAERLGLAVTDPDRLDSAVESEVPGVRTLIAVFGSQLRETLEILAIYYDLRSFLLTGGLLGGEFGAAVLASLLNSESAGKVDITRSPEPVYDSAIGAAWAAVGPPEPEERTGER